MDRYAQAVFDRKCNFAECPDDKQYTIVDADIGFRDGLLDFERKDLPRRDMVQFMSSAKPGALSNSPQAEYSKLRLVAIPAYRSIRSLSLEITATDFYKILESRFDKALLRSLADGHIGFQWTTNHTFYFGTHSFAFLWYAPTLWSSTPCSSDLHLAVYFPFSEVDNGFDFLQTLHKHLKWVENPKAAAYVGVVVAWQEVKSAIDDLLHDMGDGIGIKNVSEEVFVDKANLFRLAGHQIRLNECLERVKCVGDMLSLLQDIFSYLAVDIEISTAMRLLQNQAKYEQDRLLTQKEKCSILAAAMQFKVASGDWLEVA